MSLPCIVSRVLISYVTKDFSEQQGYLFIYFKVDSFRVELRKCILRYSVSQLLKNRDPEGDGDAKEGMKCLPSWEENTRVGEFFPECTVSPMTFPLVVFSPPQTTSSHVPSEAFYLDAKMEQKCPLAMCLYFGSQCFIFLTLSKPMYE